MTGVQTCALPISVSTNVAGLADLPTLQCDPEVTSLKNAILEAVIDREAIGEKQKVEVQKTFNMHNWSETRSEERRVGKECRSWWSSCH